MAKHEPYRSRIELLQGTLDMLILRTLQWGPQHGHGIGVAIRAGSEDVLQVEHGSLYPALHRLQKEGWIESEWKLSEHNQRARFYRLTAAGERGVDEDGPLCGSVLKKGRRTSARWLIFRGDRAESWPWQLAAPLLNEFLLRIQVAVAVKRGLAALM